MILKGGNKDVKNWRTTLIGCMGAIAYSLEDALSKGTIDRKTLILAAVIAALGFISKDFNVTGGTVPTNKKEV
jgi:hypothetical protein